RGILLHYRGIICRGAPYTEADCNWIGDVLADSRTELDAYNNEPINLEPLDEQRPLITAAYSQSIELGKAHDRIRRLREPHDTAIQKLRDCEKQNQQTDAQAQTGEQSQTGTLTADAACALCGQPRVGHGHEGEPCRVHLGPDGLCQYHDIA
ncbi:MAG TPA: hypothetical protein VFK88_02995, partial [Gallionella sp.]|nr:hypothetical protein [Gallionella sp.]